MEEGSLRITQVVVPQPMYKATNDRALRMKQVPSFETSKLMQDKRRVEEARGVKKEKHKENGCQHVDFEWTFPMQGF